MDISLNVADQKKMRTVTVPTYADMLLKAKGGQSLIIAVIADEQNMGGERGAYIYIPNFGTGQLATNFI